MMINNCLHPMWEKFIKNKKNFIGGILEDYGDIFDQPFGKKTFLRTKIIDIKFEPNGKDSIYFSVLGEKFECGFDVKYGKIISGEEGWVSFSGYGDHKWRIKSNQLSQT